MKAAAARERSHAHRVSVHSLDRHVVGTTSLAMSVGPLIPNDIVAETDDHTRQPDQGAIMEHPFFTIGHSTRPIPAFVQMLESVDVHLVVDVRTVPRSRTNPQYNIEALPDAMAGFQIGYEHLAELGGLRGRQSGIQPAENAFWENRSFHNYADYAMSESFGRGFAKLRKLGHQRRCAIMCSEAVWWRCHRRIIADYLITAGESVFHILDVDHVQPAVLTPAARSYGDGRLTYPSTS